MTRPKQLSRAAAWTEIARRFAEDKPQFGLCKEVEWMRFVEDRISDATADAMRRDIGCFCPPIYRTWWYSTRFSGRAHDKARMWLALMMAARASR